MLKQRFDRGARKLDTQKGISFLSRSVGNTMNRNYECASSLKSLKLGA